MTGQSLLVERFSKLFVWFHKDRDHNVSFSSILIGYLNVIRWQWAEKSCYLRAIRRHSRWCDTAAATGAAEAAMSSPLQTCTHKHTHTHSETPQHMLSAPDLTASSRVVKLFTRALSAYSLPSSSNASLPPPTLTTHTQTHVLPSLFSSPYFSSSAYILSLTGPPLHGRIKVLGTTYTEHTTDYTCQLHDSIERHTKTLLGLVFSWTGLTLGKTEQWQS